MFRIKKYQNIYEDTKYESGLLNVIGLCLVDLISLDIIVNCSDFENTSQAYLKSTLKA